LIANLHQSIKVWGFIPKFSAYEETKGTYLEAVEEFWLDQRLKLTMPNKVFSSAPPGCRSKAQDIRAEEDLFTPT
jgi:hypothetical protein